ncbi:unnamed protein product, partial [marine sediment metagenome]
LKLEGMTKEREKMSYLPQGSIPLPNIRGTAPGVKLTEGDTTIFILPGVPSEMKVIFQNVVKPILKERREKYVKSGFKKWNTVWRERAIEKYEEIKNNRRQNNRY